jgi:hypothetical protein
MQCTNGIELLRLMVVTEYVIGHGMGLLDVTYFFFDAGSDKILHR